MATIKRVQGNRLELAIPLQTETMTPSGKVVADYNVPEGAEVKVLLVSAWKNLAFVPTSVSGNLVTVVDNGTLPTGKYAVEVRIKEADGTPLRSKYCNIIEVCDCNDGVTTQYDDFIEGSVQLDAQVFYFAKGDKGDDGITPHIDEETGNWFVGDTDTGVHAQGEPGATDYNDLENKPDLTIYQEKEAGKGLSTNDYTTEEKQKLANAITKEQDPTVPQWAKQPNKPSYTPQEVGALPANTPLFDGDYNSLTNKPDLSGFITISVNNLVNYYLKSETYTKTEVQTLIAAIQQFHYEIYASISAVTSPAGNVLYLIGPTGTGADKYEEYVYDSTKQEPWVKIGDTSIDLSGYYTSQQTDNAITSALNTALADYTSTAALTLLLAGKQDVINDLATIRSGAAAGATAVQPEAGKGLFSGSYNDLTDKPTIPTVPTNVSAFTNDAGYITKTVDDLANYYLKSETYTKTEVQTLINAVKQFTYEVVQTLPTATAGTMNKIYLVPSADPQTQNVKDEYITIDNGTEAQARYTWEQIGSTEIDLSGYYTSQQTDAAITAALNTALADYTTTDALTLLLAGKQDTISDLSTIRSGAQAGATAYQKPQAGIPVSDLALGMDNVPTSGSDNFVKSGGVYSALQGKQDTLVSGANIKTINNQSILGSGNITIQGGGSSVQSDWNQTDTEADDYIKNKPTIPTITFRTWTTT